MAVCFFICPPGPVAAFFRVCYTTVMKRIAICDDEPQVLAELHNTINKYARTRQILLEVREYNSAEPLLRSDLAFDLLILDIQMGGMDGMEAARKLRALGASCPIIFLTALKDYVFEAFDVDASNYLLKPIDNTKLFAALDKSLNKTNNELLIKQGYDYRKVPLADILYLEAMGRKVSICLQQEKLDYYQKFRELPKRLGDGFATSHRSFIVNLSHVRALDGNDIVMDNDDKVPIAKGRKDELTQKLLAYFQKDKP